MRRFLLALFATTAMVSVAHADATDTQWQVVSRDQSTCYPMGEVFRLGSGPMNSPEALQQMLPTPRPGEAEPMKLRRTSGETVIFESYDDDKFYAQLLVKGRTNCLQMLQAVRTQAQVTGKLKAFVAAYRDYRAEVAQGHPPGVARQQDSTWFVASGSTMTCIPMPQSLVAQAVGYWSNQGHYAMTRKLPSGAEMLVIPEGDNTSFMAYQSRSDCLQWLPIAAQNESERRR